MSLKTYYDSNVTTFSPEGRLFQVEYAMTATEHSATCVAISASDGIILACEKRARSRLVELSSTTRFQILNDQIICILNGLLADGQVLVDYARQVLLRYKITNGTEMPCEQLVRRVCELMQGYTQHGGLRPFAVSILFACWDYEQGFRLYKCQSGGDYLRWKAVCAGRGSATANHILETTYNEEGDLKSACALALAALRGTSESSLNSKNVEIATLGKTADGQIRHNIWSNDEIDCRLREMDLD